MTPTPDPLTVFAVLLVPLTLGYILTCVVWPFRRCRRCHGQGHHRAPLLRAFRPCHRCNGTGMHLRAGRRLWNTARRARNTRR